MQEWQRTRPFQIQALTPALLGDHAPTGRDVVHFGESAYAKFSRDFERATTAEILKHDPKQVVVLVNDVSEGPDFDQLAARGYRIFTIYHVDVVAYVTSVYLRERLLPETTVRWYRKLRWLMPDMAGLVWDKQEASVRSSQGLIVPSEGMRDVLLRCYPDCSPSKIHVLPWGMWNATEPTDTDQTINLREEFRIPDNAHILLTLSRISPEKGQDSLLKALLDWEQRPDYPANPLYVFICGDAAFMQGLRFMDKLKSLAARLKRTKVIFPGYVTGARKRAFFSLADLYIFPSRHESYGLTLLEALASGLPAVCLDTAGARSVMRPEFGALVQNREELRAAIARLLADPDARQRMSAAAQAFASDERFSDRAAQLATLLLST
jgi:glycosyltransferase involved in cell wall biosynthesis